MATKPAAPAFAFGEDEESTLANQRYKDAYDRLTQAIDARSEKPWFDPTLLAAAQGFLAPTRTGNFFEALGNAAGTLGKAEETQQAKEIELAKMRMELAEMGLGQANQRAAMKEYKEASKAATQGAPQGVPQPGPQGSSSLLSSMGYEDQGQQVGPPQPLLTERQFVAAQGIKGISPIEAKMEYQKLLRDDLKVGPNGTVYQISTGRLYAPEDPTIFKVSFLSLNGEEFPVSRRQANQLNAFIDSGDIQGRIDYENKLRGLGKPAPKPAPAAAPAPYVPKPPSGPVTENPPMGAVPMTTPEDQERVTTGTTNPADFGYKPAQVGNLSAPAVVTAKPANFGPSPALAPAAPTPAAPPAAVTPSEPPPSAGMKSPAQLTKEAANAAARRDMELRVEEEKLKSAQAQQNLKPNAIAKAEAEGEVKARQEIEDSRKEAFTTLTYANQFRKYAELPGSQKMFGILNREGIAPAIAKLVESGVGVRGYTVGIPAIEDVMRNANLNTTEQAQYRSFLQLATQLQLQRAKYMKGSVSNYEQTILADAGITAQDTPETIRRKADIMSARALFDRQVANKQDKFKGDALQFLKSDDYAKMVLDYDAKLMRIISGQTEMRPREQAPRPRQSGSPISAADSLLGIR